MAADGLIGRVYDKGGFFARDNVLTVRLQRCKHARCVRFPSIRMGGVSPHQGNADHAAIRSPEIRLTLPREKAPDMPRQSTNSTSTTLRESFRNGRPTSSCKRSPSFLLSSSCMCVHVDAVAIYGHTRVAVK